MWRRKMGKQCFSFTSVWMVISLRRSCVVTMGWKLRIHLGDGKLKKLRLQALRKQYEMLTMEEGEFVSQYSRNWGFKHWESNGEGSSKNQESFKKDKAKHASGQKKRIDKKDIQCYNFHINEGTMHLNAGLREFKGIKVMKHNLIIMIVMTQMKSSCWLQSKLMMNIMVNGMIHDA